MHTNMAKFAVVFLIFLVITVAQGQDLCFNFYRGSCLSACEPEHNVHSEDILCTVSGGVCCSSETEEVVPPPPNPDTDTVADSDRCGINGGVTGGLTRRSVGRDVSARCSWPWLVSIRMSLRSDTSNISASHVLTGILVAKDKVMVVAELFDNIYDSIPGVNVEAVVGEYLLNMEGDEKQVYTIDVTQAETQGEFKLLSLGEEVVVGDCVRPACRLDTGAPDMPQQDCRVIGWGTADTGTGSLTNVPAPLQSNVSIDDGAICERLFDFVPLTYNSSAMCLKIQDQLQLTEGDRGNGVVCSDDQGRWHLTGFITHEGFTAGCDDTSASAPKVGPFAVRIPPVV